MDEISKDYNRLPTYIQLELQDHANILLSFRPLLDGLRTPEQQTECSQGYDFVRLYKPHILDSEEEVSRKQIGEYAEQLNDLLQEVNTMVAEGNVDLERMVEIRDVADFMMYGRKRR